MDLYERIKQLRKELGLTQDELAHKLGYNDRSSIAKIESGKVDLPESKIIAFAKALNTTPSELMGWNEGETDNEHYYLNNDARELAEFLYDNPNYKVLFDASRKVKPEDIDFVKQMIERMGGTDG